jgi:aconitate hydratase
VTAVGQDSLKTRSTLEAGGRSYAYYSIRKAAEQLGDVSRLPFSMKVLLENLLRFEDGDHGHARGHPGAGRLAGE